MYKKSLTITFFRTKESNQKWNNSDQLFYETETEK